jgi:hypothetical protein
MKVVDYGRKQVKCGVEIKKKSSGTYLELGVGSAGTTDYLQRNPSRVVNECLSAILRVLRNGRFATFFLGLSLEPEESSVHFPFLKVHFNIILSHKEIPCLV